jgi:uncharacterized protein (TIRG00374 family)
LPNPSKSQQWKTAAKVLFGLGLLVGLFLMVNPDQLLKSIVSADAPLLIAGFMLYSAQGVFESGRLRIAFAQYGIGLKESVQLFIVGLFFSNFMPSTLGADVYQVRQMHLIRPGLLRPISLSLYLRLSGVAINLVIAIMALFLGSTSWATSFQVQASSIFISNWIVFIIAGLSLSFVALLLTPWGRKLVRYLLGESRKIVREVVAVSTSLTIPQHLMIVVLGVFVILSRVASLIVLTWALGTSISFLNILVTVTVTTLILIVPISIAGLGISEISTAALLVASGLPPTVAVAIPLLVRCFTWILSLAGGVWFVLTPVRKNGRL